MKNLLIVIIILFSIPFQSTWSQGHHIEVEVKNSPDTIMYLVNYNADKQYIKDTVENQGNGKFIFKGDKPLPQGIYLAVRQDKNYFEFLVSDDQKFKLSTSYDNMVEDMNVKGSSENTFFYDFLKYSSPKNQQLMQYQNQIKNLAANDTVKKRRLQHKADSLQKLINNYKEDFITRHPETFMAKIYKASQDPEIPDAPEELSEEEKQKWQYQYFVKHYFDNLDLTDESLLHTPVLHQRVSNYINNVVLQDPDSIIKAADMLLSKAKGNEEVTRYLTWFITYNAEQSDIMGMDKVFVYMADNYFSDEKTPWMSKKVLKNIKDRADKLRNLLIGAKAPNMLLMDTALNPVPLHSIDAKYLMIYFYETDCGHCQRQTPKLKRLYHDMKDQGLEVYAVNINRNEPEEMKKYINDNELDWINVYDAKSWTSFHNLYDLISTPTIYLLDQDKKIMAKRINVKQVRRLLEREMDDDE